MNPVEMRQKAAKLKQEARAILDLAKKENRNNTAEELNKFDAMLGDADNLERQATAEERAASLGDLRSIIGPFQDDGKADPEKEAEKEARNHSDAFSAYLRRGYSGMTDEQRSVLARHESRDFASGTAAAGGNTVAPEFFNRLEKAMKFFGGILNVAEIIRTNTGATFSLPSVNDTGATGELLAENAAAASDASTPFGTLSLPAYMFDSKMVAVSMQLMQDSAFNVEELLANLLGERLGRVLNTYLTTGTGTSQPAGIVTGATLGKTGTAGQTTSIIVDDLYDLIYSVDPAYRNSGKCRFMLNDSSLKVIRKLKDTQGRPLWEPSLQAAGQPEMLCGFPVDINNDVAVMAANAKSVLFGDLSKYKVRMVLDTQVLRLNERYADKLQVGFIAFMRAGGALLDAGTNPVKYYANSAT
jgi:HK97 family phage major capsid protein